jgi:molecular chaperone GrpE
MIPRAMADEDPDDSAPPFDAVKAAAEFAAAMADHPPAPADGEAPSDGGDNYTAILEDEIENLKSLLAEKEQALADAHKRAAAAKAEVDVVRARIERSAAETIEHKRRSVLASFLDVADLLDRAVAELDNSEVADALAQGVRAVRLELHNILGRHGAKHRPATGHPFDPQHHEAIATAPATADAPAGTVAAVVSEGYVLGEATLRVARVVVAKG